MPRTQALIGAEGTTFAQLVRLALAVLPLARDAPHRPLRAQPRRARHRPAVRRLRAARPPRDARRVAAARRLRDGAASASTSTTTGAATRPRCRRAGPSGTGSWTRRPTPTTATRSTTTACCAQVRAARLPERRAHRARRGHDRAPRRLRAALLPVGRPTSRRTTGCPREPGDPPGWRRPCPRRGTPACSRRRRSRASPPSTRPTCATSRARSGRARGSSWAHAVRRSTSTTGRSWRRCRRSTRASRRSSTRCGAAASSTTR